jgi:hypothetical protein
MFCLANFVLRQHLRESYPGKQGEKQRENRHSHSGRQAGRQTGRQADRKIGRQKHGGDTDQQANRHRDKDTFFSSIEKEVEYIHFYLKYFGTVCTNTHAIRVHNMSVYSKILSIKKDQYNLVQK